jgi:hypothetical protein
VFVDYVKVDGQKLEGINPLPREMEREIYTDGEGNTYILAKDSLQFGLDGGMFENLRRATSDS